MLTVSEVKAHYEGMRKGIYLYAYMRDGVFYVGTTGRTLKEAMVEVDRQLKEELQRLGVEE